jgi:uncharacterized protein (DUF1015 family)
MEEVVTPPYDVISEEDAARFLEKNAYNMIQLDLRNTSQDGGGNAERYVRARTLFEAWQAEGVLVRDEQPAIYLYSITYTHPSGRRMTRKGLICLVGLAEFSEGIVKPHEKTFEAVIADRLQLMRECQAQFSKVFSLFQDQDNVVIATLEQAREDQPFCSLRDHNGNIHTLWRVIDPAALAGVARYFADRPLYIADGHHRYTTALGCRRQELLNNPDLPPDSPFNYIMMYLCATGDEGLAVLPTHRLLRYPGRISAEQCVARLRQGLAAEEIRGATREVLLAEVLARMNEWTMSSPVPVFGLYHPGEDRCFLLTLRDECGQYPVLAAKPRVLRGLDVVILSELLLQDLLGLPHQRITTEKLLNYFSDPDEAIDVAVKRSVEDDGTTPLLFLLNPTRVSQVTEVADSGQIMPHKSTYFFPKILTGLLINKLDPGEKIRLPGQGRG